PAFRSGKRWKQTCGEEPATRPQIRGGGEANAKRAARCPWTRTSGAQVGRGGGADAKRAASCSRIRSSGAQVGGGGAANAERTGSCSRDRPSGAQVCGGGRRVANTEPVAAAADSAHGNPRIPRLCASRQSSNFNHLRSGAVGSEGASWRSRVCDHTSARLP